MNRTTAQSSTGAFLLIAVLIWSIASATSHAEVLTSDPNNGDSTNRVDIVFLGDGYQTHELDLYQQHVDGMLEHLFQEAPFDRYQNFFNIHRIDVVSNESGADVPPEGTFADTALGATYFYDATDDFEGTDRVLYVDAQLVEPVFLRSIPIFGEGAFIPEVSMISVNSERLGGSSLQYGVFAGGNPDAHEIAVHELGHQIGNLADEYFDIGSGSYVDSGFDVLEANVTESPTGDKWAHWIGYEDPVLGTIGAYEGARYHESGIYRPSDNSKMQSLNQPFDAVSREALILEFYSHVDPIDSVSDQASVDANELIQIQTVDSDVFDVTWSINGQSIDGLAAEEFRFEQLTELGFLPGTYEVEATATDNTEWVRVATDELQESATWQVSYFPGDFDDDLSVNAVDMDALSVAVESMSSDLLFDLNEDGLVNDLDRNRWVAVNQTHYGDADLDGEVNFSDFLLLSQNFGQDGGWAAGDFDGDNEINFTDFLLLSQNFGAERPIIASAVPEPAGRTLLMLGTVALLSFRRRRQRSH